MYEIQERMEEMATIYYRNYRQNKQFLMLKEEFSFNFRLAESNNSHQKSFKSLYSTNNHAHIDIYHRTVLRD